MPSLDIERRWRAGLTEHGFDLVMAFDVATYNRVTPSEDFRLPDFGRCDALGLFVANSKALWPRFTDWLQQHSSAAARQHPLDEYTEDVIGALRASESTASEAFFSHRTNPTVPMQRLAQAAGLAQLSPSHLSVHPEYGPWIGLRAVVVFDLEPSLPPPRQPRPCAGCSEPCLQALHAATSPGSDGERSQWRRWLAVRDACPIGTAHRYGPNQIGYHYTKDRSLLRGE